MSRIIAETGIFYIQAFWLPSAILIGFFGHRFVGTEAAVILLVLCSVLMIDPREALMPFMTNSLKLLEEKKINISKASSLCMAAIIIGLAVCVPWTIYLQYKNGPPSRDWWARVAVPPAPFREAAKVDYRLKALGPEVIKNSNGTKGFDRFTNFKAMPREYWIFLFVGITMVSLFAFARLRFTWFPLHPIIFLVWSTAPARRIGFAFLIGWLLKMLITKYGGVQVYNKLKPLMLGFIAGELLGAFLPIIVSLIYYFMTGQPAAPFRVFPG